ncbi:hypothetical protein X975_25839, partial [Stegodyphus mimosarum]
MRLAEGREFVHCTTVHVPAQGTKLSISKYERYQEKIESNPVWP